MHRSLLFILSWCCLVGVPLGDMWGVDQKPLVIDPATGRTQQLQTGNNLTLPSGLLVASTTSATTSITGAAVIGNGVAATSVGIGGGNIIAGGKLVTSDRVGFGGSHNSGAIVTAGQTNPLIGVNQTAFFAAHTGTSAATTGIRGFQSALGTAAAVFTCPDVLSFTCNTIIKGSGSTITRATSFHANEETAGTNNCGLFIGPSLAYTGNWAIYSSTTRDSYFAGGLQIAGTVTLDGATAKCLSYTNGTANAAVGVTFGAVGPTGSTAGNQVGWMRVNVGGTDRYVPYW